MVSALNRFIAKQKSPEIRFTNLFAYFSGWPVCKLFGLFMLIAGPVCLLLTPPFQVADESNHFMRAIQISQNQPIAITRTPNEKGAFVPDTVIPFVAVFSPMMFAPEKKLTPHMLTALQSAR